MGPLSLPPPPPPPPPLPSFCQLTKQNLSPPFNVDVIADARTEWHRLQVKRLQDCNKLPERLVAMLDLFGQWNRWEEMGDVDGPTSRFESIVDDTWHCDAEEAIARFIN